MDADRPVEGRRLGGDEKARYLAEWRRLEADALAQLRDGWYATEGRRRGTSLARALVHRSHSDPTAYEAARDREGHLWVARAVWQMGADMHRLRLAGADAGPFDPTVDVARGEAHGAAFDRLLRALARASVPGVPPPGASGLDGTSYELALGDDYWTWVRYAWWSKPPEGWEPVARFLDGFVRLAEAAIDGASASEPEPGRSHRSGRWWEDWRI
jgi:hypothetical protein